MARFNLFDLPAELLLDILEQCRTGDLAAFARTSKTCRQIGVKILKTIPLEQIIQEFNQASLQRDNKTVLSLLPFIRHANKTNPEIGFQALIQICGGSCGEAVWELVKGGVPIFRPEDETETSRAIDAAQRNRYPGPLQAILDFLPVDGDGRLRIPSKQRFVRGQNGHEALRTAIVHGNTSAVKQLLRQGVDVNHGPGDPVSFLALDQWQKGPFECLLAHGADIHTRNEQGLTVLHLAASKSDLTKINILLDAGARVDDTERLGHTALLMAVGHGHGTIAKQLLQQGADVNAINKFGRSALSIAAAMGRDKLVTLLLESGADVHQICPDGYTALSYAVASGSQETSKILAKASGVAFDPSTLGHGPVDYTQLRLYDRTIASLRPWINKLSEHTGQTFAAKTRDDIDCVLRFFMIYLAFSWTGPN
ncbi:ankyrin repeat-containing domain protein [Aspergillus karnatakaensis]|uniref:ankyrin repeat-containing domain protein n=1 Tax=Aspergillus karnatakaensis TaxID=1810916 RepID=UPI003CCD1404